MAGRGRHRPGITPSAVRSVTRSAAASFSTRTDPRMPPANPPRPLTQRPRPVRTSPATVSRQPLSVTTPLTVAAKPVLTTVNVIGNSAGITPSWYSTGAAACGACHGNPPRNGTDGSNVWHSGYHGGQGPTGAYNQCQFCHPDATGSGGQGTGITNPSLHANGTINVQATFTSKCFNCH